MTTIPEDTVEIVGYDAISAIARDGDLYYRLTNCHQASATGVQDGTACRACYELVDPIFGAAYTAAEVAKMLTAADPFAGIVDVPTNDGWDT